jgi:hypothetical protein
MSGATTFDHMAIDAANSHDHAFAFPSARA